MRTLPMCFNMLLVPRCRLYTLASSWWQSLHGLKDKNRIPLLSLSTTGLEGDRSRRWTRRTITTNGLNETTLTSKRSIINNQIVEGAASTSITLDVEKSNVQTLQFHDVQTTITKKTDMGTLSSLVTVMVFDFETTGTSKTHDRIVEIALRDILGGENSTFQTLVNPERFVPNTYVHGITTNMVNRTEVPRMVDLIPILQEYVRSRQKPGGYVLWVAHNARTFDVPFMINEFSRCSKEIPADWLFMDTIPLAREWIKTGGSKVPSGYSLQALREHYEIPVVGSAHRAISDVHVLAAVLQRLTFDLKLPLSSLIERSFKASDIIILKKKKIQ